MSAWHVRGRAAPPAPASRRSSRLQREFNDAEFHATARGRRDRRPRACTCTATSYDTKSLDRAIAGLALPALGTELIDPLLSVCDTAFVGRLGAEPLAGVAIASSVFTYAVLFFNFLSTASAPLIAQALAKGDETAARKTTKNAITLAVVLGSVTCVLLEWNADLAIQAVSGQTSSQLAVASENAVQYLRVRALGIPFSLLSTALGGAFRGKLDTRTPLAAAAAANSLNLLLDPLLIFGLGPIAPLAAPGAAAATVVAEAVAAALLLKELHATPLWPQGLEMPAWEGVQTFAGASFAVNVRTAALQSTLLLATATVSRHAGAGGVVVVAAHQAELPQAPWFIFEMVGYVAACTQVTLQTWFFLSYFMDSLAIAANGLVADSLGRGDVERARQAAERCCAYGFAISIALLLLLGIAPMSVAAVFTEVTAIQVVAAQGIVVVAAMQPLNAVVFIGDGVFQGATDFLYLALSMAVACGLSAGAMLVGGGGLQDVWIALFALQLLRTVAVAARYADAVPVLGGSPLARRAL